MPGGRIMLDVFSIFSRKLSEEEMDQIFSQFQKKSEELENQGGWEIVAAGQRLWSYLKSPSSSIVVKGLAGAALLYFVVPLDAVPDITPFIGYVDDLAVMMAALANIARATKTVSDTRKYQHLKVIK